MPAGGSVDRLERVREGPGGGGWYIPGGGPWSEHKERQPEQRLVSSQFFFSKKISKDDERVK